MATPQPPRRAPQRPELDWRSVQPRLRGARLGIFGKASTERTRAALDAASRFAGDGEIAVICSRGNAQGLESLSRRYTNLVAIELATHSPSLLELAIDDAAARGYRVLVVDELSAAWSATGGVLDSVSLAERQGVTGVWAEVNPRIDSLLDAVRRFRGHIVCTSAAKSTLFTRGGETVEVLEPEFRRCMQSFDVWLELSGGEAWARNSYCDAIDSTQPLAAWDAANTLCDWLSAAQRGPALALVQGQHPATGDRKRAAHTPRQAAGARHEQNHPAGPQRGRTAEPKGERSTSNATGRAAAPADRVQAAARAAAAAAGVYRLTKPPHVGEPITSIDEDWLARHAQGESRLAAECRKELERRGTTAEEVLEQIAAERYFAAERGEQQEAADSQEPTTELDEEYTEVDSCEDAQDVSSEAAIESTKPEESTEAVEDWPRVDESTRPLAAKDGNGNGSEADSAWPEAGPGEEAEPTSEFARALALQQSIAGSRPSRRRSSAPGPESTTTAP